VPDVRRNTALGVLAAAGALGALLARRRRPDAAAPAQTASPDPRAAELRRKLARARAEPPTTEPPRDEFEAMRRRIHAEAREAAERMRASGEAPDS
jgi:hypothetical protein